MEDDEPRALLAAIIAGSDDAIVSKTLDGIIRSWNGGAERIFGYTAKEAVGRSINLIIPPELRDEEKAILARLARGERIEHFETVRQRKDGRRVDISLTVSPVLDSNGRVLGVSKVARDITERKRMERARRESEERFRTLADNITQLVWMADGEGTLVWVNRRWYEFTGTTEAEMLGSGWARVVHPDHLGRVVGKLRDCFERGQPWGDTFPLRGGDGQYRWFLSSAAPILDERGEITKWFGTHTDVTAEREAEQRLREADQRKDEFLAMLGHELRNPLASIVMATELLKTAREPAAPVHRALEVLERQTFQMTALVDGLLEVSRIARGKIQLETTVVDLRGVLEEVMQDRSGQLESAGLTAELDLPDDPVWTWGDRVRLVQVADNLLGNAIKFTPAPGSIHLSVRVEGDDVVFCVRDTGIGIRPELLPRMFEPFQQDAQDLARVSGGLGLGLSLCKGIVGLHAGQIAARSEGPGKGSEFQVRLPRSSPPANDTDEISKVTAAPRRVLLVEDNPDAASVLSELLELKGHRVCVASTGSEALELLRKNGTDVVLCDLGLPGLDGYELARRVRKHPELGETPLVAVTGYGQPDDRRRSLEAGFDEHLTKPVDLRTLEKTMARVTAARHAS